MTLLKKYAISISITSRVLLALIGGYILANLVAILIATLSGAYIANNGQRHGSIDDIVAGMMVSFIVYALAVIVVFSTKSAINATLYITASCMTVFAINSYLYMAIT